MRGIRALMPIIVVGMLAACAGTYQVVRMPQREADLFPLSETQAGVTIAIDEIKDAARAQRYFGVDLIKHGVVPVAIVVSNYGEHRVLVKPSDVLLHRGSEILDPLPIETVMALAKDERWFLRARTQEQIDAFFESVVFTENALLPNETYQGVLFFSFPEPRDTEKTYFTMLSLYREGGPKVRVGVTNVQTRERLHFGPFSITRPEDIL